MELYEVFSRGIRRMLDIPIPEDLRKCKLCKKMVRVQDMAIKALPASDYHWKPANADHCIACADARGEGTKDDDGHDKRIGVPEGRRIKDGFEMLRDSRRFGE